MVTNLAAIRYLFWRMKMALTANSPKALMQLAKQGDADAFTKIYELYFVPIFRYIHLRVKNPQDTEDLTQAVFLKAYQSISRFEEQGKSPLAYFFTIARNAVIDYWRKKKEIPFGSPEEIQEIIELPQAKENTEEIIQKNEAASALKRAIQKLTEEQQSVIILKFIESLSNKEISHIMQKNEAAVRQLQSRGLKALRQHLKNYD